MTTAIWVIPFALMLPYASLFWTAVLSIVIGVVSTLIERELVQPTVIFEAAS